ncbi:hypothetical protein RHABOEDO_000955 [Candidatus Rhabdochlamydia oedothoracis]|uniref:Uncharacterized protein n=1 Tax=Candidatus Rhabdochlamydia oedothoracis TaxID=2720720 RepID=A0ABX8V6V7_9BACT|nr:MULTISPECIES: hypothetical protein [Rhabdochlamydia]KAG6559744.1 hypothetical protein RHOW815_000239 [Candidatus Rhabdochlamydia sp. W815]MCL6755755.1 hypothetical protein [Candidatus Rhabdochlamydia oedothoracis]QYF48743.1 hypothetical protein RHABOEDO_000955 [Candidatus Rhabdochlamydia oedothoracis]
MPKKYTQLLLSINICLTAVATATGSDASSNDSFVVVPDHEISKASDTYWANEEHDRKYPEITSQDQDPNFDPSVELSNQFYHIWHRLEKINKIYPSELLQRALLQHQENLENPIPYDASKSQQDLTHDILVQFIDFYDDLEALSKYQFKEELDENLQVVLKIQFAEICKCVNRVHDLYKEKALSKSDQLFLSHQLKELLVFSQSFLAEDSSISSNTTALSNETLYLVKKDTDATSKPFPDESSPTKVELDNQFNQIWDCLDEINTIHQSELLQSLISHHRDVEIPYDESLEEVSKEILENQFIQLYKSLAICSQHEPREGLGEESRLKLDIQLDQIKRCLNTIYMIYNSKKEFLSKEEKAFLRDQLEELHNFSCNFIRQNSLQEENIDKVELSSLDKIQALLNSCEEENSLIYPQYEYIINSQKANISNLLTSSKTESTIENQLLYFNKAEGLMEIQHTELSEDGEYAEPYTTTWKIRPADINLVKDWKEQDPITIDNTNIFSKYTMRGEKLDYTLTNHKKSVRANFICKSSNKNTYTILSIDYLENIVVLKNGPCLFVQDGELKEWHIKDVVILQRSGSVIDANNPHELINKTRGNKKTWVSLKK